MHWALAAAASIAQTLEVGRRWLAAAGTRWSGEKIAVVGQSTPVRCSMHRAPAVAASLGQMLPAAALLPVLLEEVKPL